MHSPKNERTTATHNVDESHNAEPKPNTEGTTMQNKLFTKFKIGKTTCCIQNQGSSYF